MISVQTPPQRLATAATGCAKWRRKSRPVELRENGGKALVVGVASRLKVWAMGCRRWLFLPRLDCVTRPAFSLLGGGEPEAVAIHFYDMDMMGQTVEQDRGQPFGVESRSIPSMRDPGAAAARRGYFRAPSGLLFRGRIVAIAGRHAFMRHLLKSRR